MTFNDLLTGEVWMSPEERLTHTNFITAVTAQLDARKVPASATLILRVAEAANLLHLARRLERGLTPSPEDPGNYSVTPALAEQIGKARERLRKALKEIEDTCATLGARASRGFADEIRPMLDKGADLLNDPRVTHETVAEIVPPETDNEDPDPGTTRAITPPAPAGRAPGRARAAARAPPCNHSPRHRHTPP
ncbi:MAG: hypothetical protein H3C30_17660 [Candidatus Hydrogenedentes bacterium]|nr:hypothetical protein [Candidatus Hydrogenedentota bacterium]